ncbi:D-lactaldehyde dehydrogenase [Cylindrobasidium torrendii FP15055 ss-10]|uniref:D-lactaldehyde dehydrogenase n=1 Tax=Cylindrobasidium torrendii FP15055 ss-10 TaxID=1314674 RepID=A0A0D7BUP3_9AGAR|nr:D-lactaldehyde dehydrogenase [Cylindrobasidium torrendii FP15055 ss-10]
MPALVASPSTKVLVSGANGYIAMWVVRRLLESGFSVRGTVRNAEKARFLTQTFEKYGDKLEIAMVDDITKEGAFDEAVKGVDAIEHTASPFHYRAKEPHEFFEPAIKGTVGMLNSALKYGQGVKRIVVTSSCAAVFQVKEENQVLSEKDFNYQSQREVDEGERDPQVMYRASKSLAEKAAWDFWKEHKAEVSWDLVVLNPPLVLGPPIHEVDKPENLNTSMFAFYTALVKQDNGWDETAYLKSGGCWVDVRDIAEAHVRSLEREAAGGERIIIAAPTPHYTWQEWVDTANLNRGRPGAWKGITPKITYDTALEQRVLGLNKRTMSETVNDILFDFKARGW